MDRIDTVEPDLARLFRARHIALVGASAKSSWTQKILENHKRYGFTSTLHLVNRRAEPVLGRSTTATCAAIEAQVDVAYLSVPRAGMMDALKDVAEARIPYAIMLTSGFAEIGEEGRREQEVLVQFARANGIAFLGPNCLGFVNHDAHTGITAIPPVLPLIPGRIGIISQSGYAANEMMSFGQQQNIGYSFSCATGNEAMVECSEIMEYLVDDDAVDSIVLFLEAIRDPSGFVAAAERARCKGKPVVVVKLGRNELSSAVAMSHTGGLVGDDTVFDAVCDRYGIVRCATLDEAVTTANLIGSIGPITKPGVGFISISGGTCGLIADLAQEHGVSLPAFTDETKAQLGNVMAEYGATHNPFDITGAAVHQPELFEKAISVIAKDPQIGMLAVVHTLPPSVDVDPSKVARASMAKGLRESGLPGGLISQCMRPVSPYARQMLTDDPVAFAIGGFELALRAMSKLWWWSQRRNSTRATTSVLAPQGPRPTSERETLAFLGQSGVPVIPVRLAKSPDDASTIAAEIGGAVVMKIASPDIAHKTDIGGVKLGIVGADAARSAYAEIMASVGRHAPDAHIDGVLVVPMRHSAFELLVGTHNDPLWGPSIMVGLGGIWVEALKDTRMRLLPVTPAEVVEMLESLRAAPLLKGSRGSKPADLAALSTAIAQIGDAALALGPDLQSLEVNPLRCNGSEVEALDALAVWRHPEEK